MLQINVHDPKIKLSDLIEAAEKGEEIFIVTDTKKTYKIIEVEKLKRRGNAGSAKGMIEIADDFDAPFEAFKDYMPADQPKQESRIFVTAKGRSTVSDDFDDYMQLT